MGQSSLLDLVNVGDNGVCIKSDATAIQGGRVEELLATVDHHHNREILQLQVVGTADITLPLGSIQNGKLQRRASKELALVQGALVFVGGLDELKASGDGRRDVGVQESKDTPTRLAQEVASGVHLEANHQRCLVVIDPRLDRMGIGKGARVDVLTVVFQRDQTGAAGAEQPGKIHVCGLENGDLLIVDLRLLVDQLDSLRIGLGVVNEDKRDIILALDGVKIPGCDGLGRGAKHIRNSCKVRNTDQRPHLSIKPNIENLRSRPKGILSDVFTRANLVVLDRSAKLVKLDGGVSADILAIAELLVLGAINLGNVDLALQVVSKFLPDRGQGLTMATPRCVVFNQPWSMRCSAAVTFLVQVDNLSESIDFDLANLFRLDILGHIDVFRSHRSDKVSKSLVSSEAGVLCDEFALVIAKKEIAIEIQRL